MEAGVDDRKGKEREHEHDASLPSTGGAKESGYSHHGGSFASYMDTKRSKLEDQYRERYQTSGDEGQLLRNVVIHVNGRTDPPLSAIRELTVRNGGAYSNYLTSEGKKEVEKEVVEKKKRILNNCVYTVTHVICEQVPEARAAKLRARRPGSVPWVKTIWLLESLQKRVLQPTGRYLIPQLRLDGASDAMRMWMPATSEREENLGSERLSPKKTQLDSETDINFVANFFSKSRLHFIGSWRLRHSDMVRTILEANSERVRAKVVDPTAARRILHIDIDCFFAGVAIREEPALRGLPVAICHATGKGISSTSEISAASYEARQYGIRAGMYLGDARAKCESLQVRGYMFEQYEEVTTRFFRLLLQYTTIIEIVSCDEVFMDISDVDEGRTVGDRDVVQSIRDAVFRETGLTASVGCGPNKLIAKMCSTKAKPNGALDISLDAVPAFLEDIPIQDLHGVGRVTYEQLKQAGFRTCGALSRADSATIAAALGLKGTSDAGTATNLISRARGIDTRSVTPGGEQKSIGAEINYGIRFKTRDAVERFIKDLATEVAKRMEVIKCKGRTITIKLMKKRGHQPTYKFLGHGPCETFNRTMTEKNAFCQSKEIKEKAMDLVHQLRGFNFIEEWRGFGITVSKLQRFDVPRKLSLDKKEDEMNMDTMPARYVHMPSATEDEAPASPSEGGRPKNGVVGLGREGGQEGERVEMRAADPSQSQYDAALSSVQPLPNLSQNFEMRVVVIDWYMSRPVKQLDPVYGSLLGCAIDKVPIVRIFGPTPAGQRSVLHIHGAFPYLYVHYDNSFPQEEPEVSTFLAKFALAVETALNVPVKRQRVHLAQLVSAKDFYGYHSADQVFIKLLLYNPQDVSRAAALLSAGSVLGHKFQPYESHIPYLLQMKMDYNICGMSLVRLNSAYFHEPLAQTEESIASQSHRDGEECVRNNSHDSYDVDQRSRIIWDEQTIPSTSRFDESMRHKNGRSSSCELELHSHIEAIEKAPSRVSTRISGSKMEVHSLQTLWDEEYRRFLRMNPESRAGKGSKNLSGGISDDKGIQWPPSAPLEQCRHPPSPYCFGEVEKSIRDEVSRVLDTCAEGGNAPKSRRDSLVSSKSFNPTLSQPLSQCGGGLAELASQFDKAEIDVMVDEEKVHYVNSQLLLNRRASVIEFENGILFSPPTCEADEEREILSELIKSQRECDDILAMARPDESALRPKPQEKVSPDRRGEETNVCDAGAGESNDASSDLSLRLTPTQSESSQPEVFFSDVSSHPDDDVAAEGQRRMYRFARKPPTPHHLALTFVDYGLADVEHEVPFYSNTNDGHAPVIIAGEARRVSTRAKSTIPDFYEQGDTRGPALRNLEHHVLASRACRRRSSDVRCLVPIKSPPSRERVEAWLQRSSMRTKGGHLSLSDNYLEDQVSIDPKSATMVCLEGKGPEEEGEMNPEWVDDGVANGDGEESEEDEQRIRPASPKYEEQFNSDVYVGSLFGYSPPHKSAEQQGKDTFQSGFKECTNKTTQQSLDTSSERSSKRRRSTASRLTPAHLSSEATPPSQAGFKDANSVELSQQLRMASIEIHGITRGNLLPDPRHDAVCSIAVALYDDMKDADGLPGRTIVLIHDSNGRSDKVKNGGTYSLNSGVSTSQIDGLDDCVVTYTKSEKDLFLGFVNVIEKFDPDILMGWEIQAASLGYLADRYMRAGYSDEDDNGNDSGAPLLRRLSRVPSIAGVSESREDQYGWEHASGIAVTGRIVLNLWRIMRGELKLPIYTMESVCESVLKCRIPRISSRTLTKWMNSPNERWRLIKHLTRRASLNFALLDRLDLINRTAELAKVFGIDFYSVLSRGSQYRVESMMARLAHSQNFLLPSPSNDQVTNQPAMEALPLVMEPESKFYSSPIVVLDFQSLYPSIIIAYNLCYSTCLGRPSHMTTPGKLGILNDYSLAQEDIRNAGGADGVVAMPNGLLYTPKSTRLGILPRLLQEILDTRVMVKQRLKESVKNGDGRGRQRLLNSRQFALKLIANVTYGYTAAGFSGRMPMAELADSIVQGARDTLERAVEIVEADEAWNAKVVYGDTDSLFVHLEGRSREDAHRIGQEIADVITRQNPTPIKLKMEKVYHPCILCTKKRYVGFAYEYVSQKKPVFDAKGIETVRRDGCGLVSTILERSLRILFDSKDLSLVKQYVQRQWRRILQNRIPVQHFIFAKEVRLGTYASGSASLPLAAIVAGKAMALDDRAVPRYAERVPYVVVHGEPGARLADMVVSPHVLLESKGNLRLHSLYYIEKQIIPALQRSVGLIGVNISSWFAEIPRTMKTVPLKRPLTNECGSKTIEQFYSSRHCFVCNTLTTSERRICMECYHAPQSSLAVVKSRAAIIEAQIEGLNRLCLQCSGSDHDGFACVSLECPIFFERRKASFELEHANDAALSIDGELEEAETNGAARGDDHVPEIMSMTQVDFQVLFDLPADVQNQILQSLPESRSRHDEKVAPKMKSKKRSKQVQHLGVGKEQNIAGPRVADYRPPRMSQIDLTVLDELPISIRRELEAAYRT